MKSLPQREVKGIDTKSVVPRGSKTSEKVKADYTRRKNFKLGKTGK